MVHPRAHNANRTHHAHFQLRHAWHHDHHASHPVTRTNTHAHAHIGADSPTDSPCSVSYTHLTLPTICSV
eukprot:4790990-Alexandrium_andersonii.AAC.1